MVKVQSRGLGKGLAALIAEAPPPAASPYAGQGSNEHASPGNGIRKLTLSQVVPGKFQPRGRFSEDQLRELADSIARNGVMQPIVVRPLAGSAEQMFEIIAGERRWRAAGLAGQPTIPALVRSLSDQQALELALIENIQRADLTPLEEATGYKRLIDEFGHSHDELAKTVGKSRSHIANLLRLLGLPDDIRALLEEGKLSMGHARALLNVPQQIASHIATEAVHKQLSVRQVEAMARKGAAEAPPPADGAPAKTFIPKPRRATATATGPKDPDLMALEETLTENLGMKVEIRDVAGQGGELAISYDSLTQLDSILRKLGGDI